MNNGVTMGGGASRHMNAQRRAMAAAKLIPPLEQTIPPPPPVKRQAAVAQLQTVPTLARYAVPEQNRTSRSARSGIGG